MGGLNGIVTCILLVNKFKFQIKMMITVVSCKIMAVLHLWVIIKRKTLTFASV